MSLILNRTELEMVLHALDYAHQRVSGTQGTPADVKQENLARLEAVKAKILEALREGE